jgi:hypothetical protein
MVHSLISSENLADSGVFRNFILEGVITVALSVLAYFIVPTWSHKTSFVSLSFICSIATCHSNYLQLTESDRAHLLNRLKSDSDASDKEPFQWQYVRQALTDHLVWAYAFLYHGFSFNVLYSMSLFMVNDLFKAGRHNCQYRSPLSAVSLNVLSSA